MLPTAQKLYLSEMATLLGRDRQRLGPTERRKVSDRLNCDDSHNGLFALACALVFRLYGAPMQFAEVHKSLEASPFGTWKCARALLEMHLGAARPPPASLTFHLRELEHELQESLAWADPQLLDRLAVTGNIGPGTNTSLRKFFSGMVCLAEERLSNLLSHLGVVHLMDNCGKAMKHVLVGECSAPAVAAARGEVSDNVRGKLLRNRHL